MKPAFDSAFPSLGAVLDAHSMPDRLARLFPDRVASGAVEDCQIEDVAYRPGRSCVVLYRLRVRDGRRCRWHRFSSQLVREGALDEASAAMDAAGADDSAVYDAQSRAVFFAWPFDPVLTTLPRAAEGEAVRQAIAKAGPYVSMVAETIRCRTLSYTPQSRAALLYVLDEGTERERRLVGKLASRRNQPELHADSLALWRAAGDRLGLARPVAHLADLRLTVQEFVAGETLTRLTRSRDFPDLLRLTAEAAATMHGLSVPLGAYRPVEIERRFLERQIALLSQVSPDIAARVRRLALTLTRRLAEYHTADGPVHGDLHSANVIIADGRANLVDLDQLSNGDTASDIGRFLGSMRSRALREFGDLDALSDAREIFVEHYLSRSSTPVRRIRLYEAIWLLHGAKYLFEIQWTDWADKCDWMIGEAERVAAKLDASAPLRRTGRTKLSHAERLNWSRDSEVMLALMAPALHRSLGTDPVDCEVRQQSDGPGHTALSYRLKFRRGTSVPRTGVTGHLWSASSGRGRWSALNRHYEVLSKYPEALQLSRPLTYLSGLSMVMTFEPEGTKLSRLLAGPEGPNAVGRLARALAEFHSVPLGARRQVRRAARIEAVGRRISPIQQRDPKLHASLRAVLDEAAAKVADLPRRQGSVLQPWPLNRIRIADDQITRETLSHPVCSDILADPADIVARLLLRQVTMGLDAWPLVQTFVESYAEGADVPAHEVVAFASLATLRVAAVEAAHASRAGNAPAMLMFSQQLGAAS